MVPRVEPPSTIRSPTASKKRMKKFRDVVSPLDPADARSGVHSSEFRGMYNLAMLAGMLYVFSTLATNLLMMKEPADMKLLLSVFYSTHLLEVLVTFVCQALYAYTALIPVYMAGTDKFSNRMLINIVHHTLQSLLFFFTVVCIVWRDWSLIHAVSAFIEGLVLIMKMHSYIRTKLEISRTENEPPLADIKDYTMYLLIPSLVYETRFWRHAPPHWPAKRRRRRVAGWTNASCSACPTVAGAERDSELLNAPSSVLRQGLRADGWERWARCKVAATGLGDRDPQ